MKIEYKKPNIVDRIDKAIAQAKLPIECIRLSAPELSEFCEAKGMAFSKECEYIYKHYRVAYDWSSYR